MSVRPVHVALDLRLAAYQPAGIARYATELLHALAVAADPARWRFTALRARRDPSRPALPPGVRGCTLLTPPHHRLEQWALPAELLPLGIDLLHSPDFVPPFRRRCAAVVTVHDLGFRYYPEVMTAESRRYYGQVARAVRSARRVIVPSAATRADVLRLLPADPARVHVVPEAAGAAFHPRPGGVAAARARWAEGEPYALFVGTLEPRKGLPALLRAWARLLADGGTLPPRLVIAGGRGWLSGGLPAQAAALGLADRVVWAGRVGDTDLPLLYAGADLFVYPSRYEGFGLPVLEALASGVPVITSNVASLPEVAGDAALLVDPDDPAALAAACRRLLDDPVRRADLAARGVRRAAAFTWARTAGATLAVYAAALGERAVDGGVR